VAGGDPLLENIQIVYLIACDLLYNLFRGELVLIVPEDQTSMGNDAPDSLLSFAVGHGHDGCASVVDFEAVGFDGAESVELEVEDADMRGEAAEGYDFFLLVVYVEDVKRFLGIDAAF
jgi:hypothetical protein